MLLEPAGHIVTSHLPPIDSGKITQIMIQIKEVPVLFFQSLYAFLECACNAVSRQIALIIYEQCRHEAFPPYLEIANQRYSGTEDI